jgi:DNA-binding IclR family transcriptional regulator
VVAFAAPVLGRTGEIIAAVSVSSSPDPVLKKREKSLVGELLKSAMIISRELGYFPEAVETGVP